MCFENKTFKLFFSSKIFFIFSACTQAKADIVFILDSSGSMSKTEFGQIKRFVTDFLSDADIDSGSVRVGVNVFSEKSHIKFHLNEYTSKTDLLTAVENIKYIRGGTNTADAFKRTRTEMFTLNNGDRPNVDNIVILLTDGKSTRNTKRTIPEAQITRDAGIHVFAVAVGYKDFSELDEIASKPIELNRFAIENFAELAELKKKVFAAFCGKEICRFAQYPIIIA